MNAKAKGNERERKTMSRLEAVGYTCTRAAGSHGLWDVIAYNAVSVRLIQVKSNRRPGSVELEALQNTRVPSNCTKEIWVWKDGARAPVIELL